MNNKSQLPLKTPDYHCYPHVTFNSYIMATKSEDEYLHWIMDKYINCVLFSNFHSDTHADLFYIDVSKDNYYNEQELCCKPMFMRVEPSTLEELSSILIDMVKKCVETDTYLFCRSCFMSDPSKIFECIVVGYDDAKSTFLLKVFNQEESIHDKEIECQDFVVSFVPNLNNQITLQFWCCSNDNACDINLQRFKLELMDYLFSTNSKGIVAKDLVLGADAESALIDYLSSKIESNQKIEVRYVAEFAEHKDLMLKRIDFLYRKDIVPEALYTQFKAIAPKAIACIKIAKEYNKQCARGIGRSLIDLMKSVLSTEIASFRNLLAALR